jgi:purine-binding chemotaxis protein CheW
MALSSYVVLFRIGRQLYAVPARQVREIIHRGELVSGPGQPSILEGFLNLRGTVLPVIRLRRLFGLPPAEPGMYTPLLVAEACGVTAVLEVDEALEVVEVDEEAFRPLEKEFSPNHCAEALLALDGRDVMLLSCDRLLLEKEKECLNELQSVVQRRLRDLESAAG